MPATMRSAVMQFTMKKTSTSQSGRVTLQGMSGPTSRFRPVQQSNNVPIWVPVLGVLLIFLVAFWSRIKAFFTGEAKTSGGRWIRDRSLGGKMVFISDNAPSAGKSSAIASALPDAPAGTISAYAGYGAASKVCALPPVSSVLIVHNVVVCGFGELSHDCRRGQLTLVGRAGLCTRLHYRSHPLHRQSAASVQSES